MHYAQYSWRTLLQEKHHPGERIGVFVILLAISCTSGTLIIILLDTSTIILRNYDYSAGTLTNILMQN